MCHEETHASQQLPVLQPRSVGGISRLCALQHRRPASTKVELTCRRFRSCYDFGSYYAPEAGHGSPCESSEPSDGDEETHIRARALRTIPDLREKMRWPFD